MATQGSGDQSSSHIINRKKASASRLAAFVEFMTPVRDKEQLCQKLALNIRKEDLSLEENECLWELFDHFSVEHNGGKYWTESTFAAFFTSILPVQIDASWRQDATPVMYRLFRQLGSYPYQTQPSEDTLTFDQMSLAIMILTGIFTYPSPNKNMPDRKFCRLVFQGFTGPGTQIYQPEEGFRTRLNDMDLLDARTILSAFAARGMNAPNGECETIVGPRVPEYQTFPCPYSNKLDGRLPTSELRAWLRLMFANWPLEREKKIYDAEAEAGRWVDFLERSESSLHGNNNTSDGAVGWETFKLVMPGISVWEAFQHMFSPCFQNNWVHTMIWLDKLKSARNSPDEHSGEQMQLAIRTR